MFQKNVGSKKWLALNDVGFKKIGGKTLDSNDFATQIKFGEKIVVKNHWYRTTVMKCQIPLGLEAWVKEMEVFFI